MENSNGTGYRKVEADIRVVESRRKKEDLELAAKLEEDQAKLEEDKEKKVRVYDNDAQEALKKLEDDEKEKTKALIARHAEELRVLQERHAREKTDRVAERDAAMQALRKKHEGLRTNMIDAFTSRGEEIIVKFKSDKADIKFKRNQEDAKVKDELFETAREHSLVIAAAAVGNAQPAPRDSVNQQVTALPLRSRSQDRYRERSSGWGGDAWRTRDRSPRRAGSPPRARSPPRYQSDRDNCYRPAYEANGYNDNRSYSMYRPPSPRRDSFYNRARSRSPPRQPPSGPRNWSNYQQGNKRGRSVSPPNTMSRGTEDNHRTIPTGPRAGGGYAQKKARQQYTPFNDPVQPMEWTGNGSSGDKTITHKLPDNSPNPLTPVPAPTNNVAPPLAKTQITPAHTIPGGTLPIGRYVVPNTPNPSAFLTHFPVHRVKFIKEDGKKYEWEGRTGPNSKTGELRLTGSTYVGFEPRKDVRRPAGWCITPGTVARLFYWEKWGVIHVIKLKQEDVGPKELWMEFKEPKAEVVKGFVTSFKKEWSLFKVYPESKDDAVNPMDSCLGGNKPAK
ncbi:uncharacterized protein LY89DRAFT_778373 [Mollisia scopiformis]|uniref:Uncharacterized protein n=1 Tax=Mollisia scopiformis TaxID=149040 RepID=A0A194XP62_MOLSC|nr:uncharacterized protein LY89DRAFT_778373 [Mollisia scopiformis]KUJ22035.1 hypothetical protein LY89DRAFT_778373 [Mollisia scopiformis]